MKKFSKIVFAALLGLIIVCLSVLPAFAAGNLIVNGKNAPVGSTVTYTFSIGDTKQKLCGIHACVFFDQDFLEVKDVNTDNLVSSTVANANNGKNGRIVITNSFINGLDGLECKEMTDLFTVTFEVIKEGETEITYYIPFLYDVNTINIRNYTFTCDLAVNGNMVAENQVPLLEDISKLPDFTDIGDFVNNASGTDLGGDSLTPPDSNVQTTTHVEATTEAQTEGNASDDKLIADEESNNDKYSDEDRKNSDEKDNENSILEYLEDADISDLIFPIACVAVIVIALVVIIIVVVQLFSAKKRNKN